MLDGFLFRPRSIRLTVYHSLRYGVFSLSSIHHDPCVAAHTSNIVKSRRRKQWGNVDRQIISLSVECSAQTSLIDARIRKVVSDVQALFLFRCAHRGTQQRAHSRPDFVSFNRFQQRTPPVYEFCMPLLSVPVGKW